MVRGKPGVGTFVILALAAFYLKIEIDAILALNAGTYDQYLEELSTRKASGRTFVALGLFGVPMFSYVGIRGLLIKISRSNRGSLIIGNKIIKPKDVKSITSQSQPWRWPLRGSFLVSIAVQADSDIVYIPCGLCRNSAEIATIMVGFVRAKNPEVEVDAFLEDLIQRKGSRFHYPNS